MRVRVLFLSMLILAMGACAEPESIEKTRTQPAIPLKDPATPTKIIPSPTLRPSATATTAVPSTITSTPAIATTSKPENVIKVELSVDAANLRIGAGTEFAVMGVVTAGEDIDLIETSLDSTWYKVRTADGREGWVGSSVARVVE